MPYRTIPTTDTRYFMIVTDKNGAEQDNDPDAPNGKLSELMLSSTVENGITDVFIRCHGWHQDKAKAFAQFDSWIGAFASLDEDRRHMQQQIPSFQEMHIGFHWPSLAWGMKRGLRHQFLPCKHSDIERKDRLPYRGARRHTGSSGGIV